MKVPINVPEGTRFTCQSCGRCCQGWTVPVDQETVNRLRKHEWGGEPFEPLKGGGYPYRIKLVEGRCFFLDQQNRCRIHNEISHDAKPPACRAFPLSVVDVAGKQYARLSYWCPTVQANTGRPLEQQARWLKDVSGMSDQRSEPLTIDGTRELSARQFERIHHALRQCLIDSGSSLKDQLAAGVAVIQRIHASSLSEKDIEAAVQAVEREGVMALARESTRGGHQSLGRRALTLFLLYDRQNGRWSILPRFVTVILFNLGVWPLRSHTIGARASLRMLRQVRVAPSPTATALLTRYFLSKLDGRRYVAGDVSLAKGFNLLAAAYAMVDVLARTRAAAGGRAVCDDEDIREAVGAADLLVMEHPGLDQSGLHRRLTDAALGSPDVGAGLLTAL